MTSDEVRDGLGNGWSSVLGGLAEIQQTMVAAESSQHLLVDFEDGEQIKFATTAEAITVIRTLGDELLVVTASFFGPADTEDANV